METLTADNVVPSPSDTANFFKVLDAMVVRAMAMRVCDVPSPHFFIPDFVPNSILQKLTISIPPSNCFNQVEEGGAVLTPDSLSSFYWNAYDSLLRQLLLRLLPSFAPWLHEKEDTLLPLGMSCARLRHYPSFVCYADSSRGVPPHVDGESNVLTALTVLGYPGGKPAPVTNFFKPVGDGFEPITHYPPACGSLFVWLNLPQAWHGVIEKIGPRRLTHLVSLASFEASLK